MEGKSRFAKEKDGNRVDLSQTRFMENWPIDLRDEESEMGTLKETTSNDSDVDDDDPENDNFIPTRHCTESWTWTPPGTKDKLIYQDALEIEKRDKAQICDTAGHME